MTHFVFHNWPDIRSILLGFELLDELQRRIQQVLDDGVHIAAMVAHLGELGRLNLQGIHVYVIGAAERDNKRGSSRGGRVFATSE
jgi:hypothetical protein